MLYSKARRGFTLIELLVVIAIIAILAAILLPVFAQAREKARQSSCMSNEKQIANAVMMYNQDYDEKMPLLGWRFDLGAKRMTWIGLCQPYIKSYGVMDEADMPHAIGGAGDIWTTTGLNPTYPLRNIAIWDAYGWNADYMNFSADCSDFHWHEDASEPDYQGSGPPTPLARIAKPAETVMFVGNAFEPGTGSFCGANSLYPTHGGYYQTLAPATLTTPEGCVWSNGGWGQGSFMGPYGGFEQLRHQNMGGLTCFSDGHVKFMTAGQLAAGTNWTPDKNNSDIMVTDRSQYLWDLQ